MQKWDFRPFCGLYDILIKIKNEMIDYNEMHLFKLGSFNIMLIQ